MIDQEYVLQNLPDGTLNPAWIACRRGRLSASRIADILKSGRGGKPSETRTTYAKQLAAERLTGVANQHVNPNNPDIKRGLESEPFALALYELRYGVFLNPPAWRTHPMIELAGATPDGEIEREGLVQVKAPRQDKMLSLILEIRETGETPAQYVDQMDWELAVCPWAKYNDLALFNADMPEGKQLFVHRHNRDDKRIAELEEQARTFLAEVEFIFQTVSELEF